MEISHRYVQHSQCDRVCYSARMEADWETLTLCTPSIQKKNVSLECQGLTSEKKCGDEIPENRTRAPALLNATDLGNNPGGVGPWLHIQHVSLYSHDA